MLIHVYVSKLVSVYDIPASYTSTSHGAAIKVGPLMRTAYTRIDYDHPYAVPSNLHWRSYTTGPKEHPSTGARDWKMTQTLAKVTKHHSAHILLLGEEHSQKQAREVCRQFSRCSVLPLMLIVYTTSPGACFWMNTFQGNKCLRHLNSNIFEFTECTQYFE